MNMDLDLDLDIRNYELRDILNLFKLPSVFNELNMREAKLIVMRTHPDKSGLDKEYFLFFSKAYKILHEVYQVRAGLSRQKDAKYDDVKEDIDARRNANSDKLKRMNADEFNRWFNQTFEQNRLHDEEQDSGYGDWLRSNSNDADDAENDDDNEDNDTMDEGSTWAQRMEQLERRKKKLRDQALVVRSEVQTFDTCGGGYSLSRECPEEHSSGLNFGSSSSLAFEDLRKAHTESVIPVTHEDYEAVRKYKNINELQMSRDIDRRTFNYSETESQMARSQQLQTEDDMRRAFKLAQQDEVVRDLNKKWMAQFNAIEN